MAAVQRPANTSNDWQMHLTDTVCQYMTARLHEEIVDGPRALPAISIPMQIACEADHILAVIIQAYRECVTRDIKQGVQTNLARSNDMEITRPTVVIDKEGSILLWYLPNAISQAYQSEVWNSLGLLSIPLQRSLKSHGMGGWRNDGKNFRNDANLKGAIDLSPAWFQQGRGPSNDAHHPEVSRLLKSKSQPKEVREWLQCTAGLQAVLSGALRIMHPKMYLHGQEAIRRLRSKAAERQDEDMEAVLPMWNSVYSSMSVMVNRASPAHKDTNGRKVWLDTLLTVGNYPRLHFLVPELGIRLQYNPGT
ncbi:hypothetical protein M404DRAFT_28660, partial [Pisolithus tinctorius Marx 270]